MSDTPGIRLALPDEKGSTVVGIWDAIPGKGKEFGPWGSAISRVCYLSVGGPFGDHRPTNLILTGSPLTPADLALIAEKLEIKP